MKHGLGRVELGDWRENASGIACQENDVAWVITRYAGDFRVVDVFNRIST